jgi:hypothetical protein
MPEDSSIVVVEDGRKRTGVMLCRSFPRSQLVPTLFHTLYCPLAVESLQIGSSRFSPCRMRRITGSLA